MSQDKATLPRHNESSNTKKTQFLWNIPRTTRNMPDWQ